MKMSNEQYREYVMEHMPRSHMGRNVLRAFAVGGLICTLGQLLLESYAVMGLNEERAAAACSVTLIILGSLLTGLGIYDRIAKFAGAGTLVPITGFSNSVTAPALEFHSEGLILGTAAKMFVISGPVIVFGSAAGAVYGFVYWIWLKAAGG